MENQTESSMEIPKDKRCAGCWGNCAVQTDFRRNKRPSNFRHQHESTISQTVELAHSLNILSLHWIHPSPAADAIESPRNLDGKL